MFHEFVLAYPAFTFTVIAFIACVIAFIVGHITATSRTRDNNGLKFEGTYKRRAYKTNNHRQ